MLVVGGDSADCELDCPAALMAKYVLCFVKANVSYRRYSAHVMLYYLQLPLH